VRLPTSVFCCVRAETRNLAGSNADMAPGWENGRIGTMPVPLYLSEAEPVLLRALVHEFRHALKRVHERAHALGRPPSRTHTRALVNALERARDLERTLELRRMLALARELVPASGLRQRPLQVDKELAGPSYKDTLYSLLCDLWRYVIQSSKSPQTARVYVRVLHFIAPITRLPPELLQQIFLVIIDEATQPSLFLMAACRHWYNIVTSIRASLILGTTTSRDAVTKKLERNPWLLDIMISAEADHDDLNSLKAAYEGIFSAIEVASRWRTVVIEGFPGSTDLPDDLVDCGFRRCTNAALGRLRTFKIMHGCEMSPLLDRLLRILGTTASAELTTVEINSANAVLLLLAPVYSSVFHFIKVLCLDTPAMSEPVDLLPHLEHLETFIASHLPLSTYPLHVDLPFTRTLRHLRLKAVSIQWMGGRTLSVLKTCTLILPLHHHSVHTLGTRLPNCKDLTFEGQPLETLEGFSVNRLTHLSVKSQGWSRYHGSRQIASISNQFSNAPPLRCLHVGISASSQAWIKALALMSNLEELFLTNLRPSSLHARLFEAFLAQPPHKENWDISPAIGEWRVTLCPSLKVVGLQYDRWLRSTEEFKLAPTFMAIIWSRKWSRCSLQSFHICLTDGQKEPLELIGESRTSLRALELLRSTIRAERDQSFDLVARKAVQKILGLPACKPLVHYRTRALRYGGDTHESQTDTHSKCPLTLSSSVVKKPSTHSSLRLEYDHLGEEEDSSSCSDSSSSYDSSDCGSSDYCISSDYNPDVRPD
jgi:hypothetical protein